MSPACSGKGDHLNEATGSTYVFRLCFLGFHPALFQLYLSLPKHVCIYTGVMVLPG